MEHLTPPPCLGKTELFYSEFSDDMEEAVAICLTECDRRAKCLDIAIRNREPAGVWGGRLMIRGKPAKNIHARGRPQRQQKMGASRWTPSLDNELMMLRRRGLTWNEIEMALQISVAACRYRHLVLSASA